MAVQLGRLSMWLATLAADRPLTFLDHRLRTGNSLVGAAPWDILRQPAPGQRGRPKYSPRPLFADEDLDRDIGAAVSVRRTLALGPGDTLEQVRAKERALSGLEQDDSALGRWKRVADAWCAVWFQEAAERAYGRTSLPELMASVFHRRSVLPARTIDRVLGAAGTPRPHTTSSTGRSNFPRSSTTIGGRPAPRRRLRRRARQSAVGDVAWRSRRRAGARRRAGRGVSRRRLRARVRHLPLAGRRPRQPVSAFVERALSLLRPGGRVGLILPSGFATDHGCAALRQVFLARHEVDTLHGFENRDGLFPIHRGLKFLLTTATAAGSNRGRAREIRAAPRRNARRASRCGRGSAGRATVPGAAREG